MGDKKKKDKKDKKKKDKKKDKKDVTSNAPSEADDKEIGPDDHQLDEQVPGSVVEDEEKSAKLEDSVSQVTTSLAEGPTASLTSLPVSSGGAAASDNQSTTNTSG